MADQPFNFQNDTHFFCNLCRTVTNQKRKAYYSRHVWDPADGSEHIFEYGLWRCEGCETGTLKRIETDETGKALLDIVFYPERSESPPIEPKHYFELPKKLDNIYRETVRALNHNSRVLASVGFRALLEGICAEKGAKGRNLEEKLDSMAESGTLPRHIVTNLHAFRFIGNAAIHELRAPKWADLQLALAVIEDLLNFLYNLDYRSRELKKAQNPPRFIVSDQNKKDERDPARQDRPDGP